MAAVVQIVVRELRLVVTGGAQREEQVVQVARRVVALALHAALVAVVPQNDVRVGLQLRLAVQPHGEQTLLLVVVQPLVVVVVAVEVRVVVVAGTVEGRRDNRFMLEHFQVATTALGSRANNGVAWWFTRRLLCGRQTIATDSHATQSLCVVAVLIIIINAAAATASNVHSYRWHCSCCRVSIGIMTSSSGDNIVRSHITTRVIVIIIIVSMAVDRVSAGVAVVP